MYRYVAFVGQGYMVGFRGLALTDHGNLGIAPTEAAGR